MSKAIDTHIKAEVAREYEQNFQKSIDLALRAIEEYKKENNCKGLSEIYGSLAITYKQLFETYRTQSYRSLTKGAAENSVNVADDCKDKTSRALPYFNYGDYFDTVESDYKTAAKYYKKAIDFMQNYPPKSHKNSKVILSMKAHLYACEYRNGDASAIDKLIEVAEEIQLSNEKRYEKDVWSSGAYMKAGLLLYKVDSKRSQECMDRAKEIIDSNTELVLRKRQWDKLIEKLSNE